MFTSNVSSTEEKDVDLLFGAITPGAENLLGAKKKEVKEEEAEDTSVIPAVEKKKLPTREVAPLTEEEEADQLFPGEEEEEVKSGEITKKAAPAPKKPAQDFEVDYETVYNQFVKDGVWGEVVVPEGTEWNAETFKKIQQLQTTTQYEDLLDRTGPYGKAIIQYEKDGGNTGELLQLFREQRTVQEFDITTAEGQEEFLSSYYNAQGNSERSTARMVRALADQGPAALKEEADEKKELWDSQYKDEVQARLDQQTLQNKQMEESARNFNKVINETLVADPDTPLKERRELSNYMLNFSQQYQGREVSQFYIDMAEIQKDPVNYVELAKFIKGIKTGDYRKKLESKVQREVSAKTFMKVKNNNAISGGGSGDVDLNSNSGANFATLLKRK